MCGISFHVLSGGSRYIVEVDVEGGSRERKDPAILAQHLFNCVVVIPIQGLLTLIVFLESRISIFVYAQV